MGTDKEEEAKKNGLAAQLPEGALFVVLVGVVAVAIIAIAAVITLAFVDDVGSEIGTIATGAFGVVGTIVGAFFGIKVGTQAGASGKEDAQRTAITARAGEAEANARATVLAAHIPEDKASTVASEAANSGQEARDAVLRSMAPPGTDSPGS